MPQLNFNALASPGPQGFYQGFEQGQKEKVTSEINQIKLEELKRDRDEMVQLQEKLKGLGQDPDVGKYLDAIAATGKPEYVKMAIEGRQKLKDLDAYANLGVLQPDTAPSAMPTGAPAPVNTLAPAQRAPGEMGSGTFDPNASAAPAPVNALTPAPAPAPAPVPVNALAPVPVNALAPQPGADQIAPTQQRIRQLLNFARANPRMATQVMAEARILQDQLELYSRRGANQPAVSPLARLQSERAALLPGDPRIAAYDAAIRKESEFAPEKPAAPSDVARLIAERAALPPGDPNIPNYDAAIRKATTFAPQAVTTIRMPPLEGAEQKAKGELNVAQYKDVSAAANLATKTLPSIDTNLNILNKGFGTGFGTETVAAGAKLLAAMGVPNAQTFATNAQVFQAKATEAVLQKQLEQKGPQTESDAQRIDQIGSQLGKTTDANKFLLTVAKEQLKSDVDRRNFYDNWWKQNKTYEGAENAWYAGDGGKSLFDRPALKSYIKSTEPTTAAGKPSLDKIFGKRP